ncbi:YkvS family protein [Bacillus gaemokensis]|uniref:DUF2187 domain-containing protein n=1 Tax=Bacillus gaemokensis TaxID=574375 RepID=A0A073K6I2_9BACI|nr:YkvS family protein [Bacillus gaemokensis]KEK22879.1 hypothetical protein BAGA_15215 [Bacillus gaemokensis]KYG34680.1 hypothetical protein AZF08_09845 [Bacillus gaemokensis]
MIANIGDTVLFKRGNLKITGLVIKLYSESVLVEITDADGGKFEFDRTVVNHKNYKILNNHS